MKVPEQAIRLKCKRRAEHTEASVLRNSSINDTLLLRDLAFLKGLLGEEAWITDYYNSRTQAEGCWLYWFAVPEHRLVQLCLGPNREISWAYDKYEDYFEDVEDLADALIGAEK